MSKKGKKTQHKKHFGREVAASDAPVEQSAEEQRSIESENYSPETTAVKHPEPSAEAPPTVEQEMEELKQRLQRLGADYQNYQKRAQKQIEQAAQFAREALIKSLLTVLDNFEHSLEKGGETQDAAALMQGIQIIYDHLISVLQSSGLRRIEVKPGSPFDPALHEAMLHENNDQFPGNTVLRELARGYVVDGRTLRPAKVSVSKPPPTDEQLSSRDDQQREPKQQTNEDK